MPTSERQVKLETRITPENLRKFKATKRRLLRAVRLGKLSYDEAMRQMAEFNLDHFEFRLDDGPWRPLREAGAGVYAPIS